MLLEACNKSIRYRLQDGREIVLRFGVPVEIPEPQAQKLLSKAGRSVRVVRPENKPYPFQVDHSVGGESNALLAFQENLNPIVGLVPEDRADFYPSGRTIRYKSPLFGELEAQVLEDKGVVVWCWHPLRECETAIPKEWVLGLSEEQ